MLATANRITFNMKIDFFGGLFNPIKDVLCFVLHRAKTKVMQC